MPGINPRPTLRWDGFKALIDSAFVRRVEPVPYVQRVRERSFNRLPGLEQEHHENDQNHQQERVQYQQHRHHLLELALRWIRFRRCRRCWNWRSLKLRHRRRGDRRSWRQGCGGNSKDYRRRCRGFLCGTAQIDGSLHRGARHDAGKLSRLGQRRGLRIGGREWRGR